MGTANTIAKATDYLIYDQVSHDELNTIMTQAARSVNRTNTVSGWKALPIVVSSLGASGASPYCSMAITTYNIGGTDHTGHQLEPGSARKVCISMVGLPDGHVLAGVRGYFFPYPHATGIPDNQPAVVMSALNVVTGVKTELANVWGTASTTGVYNAGIIVSKTGLSHTIDKTNNEYVIEVTPEYGTNQDMVLLTGIQANVTVNTADAGPDFLFW
jgi:hypothetical protein